MAFRPHIFQISKCVTTSTATKMSWFQKLFGTHETDSYLQNQRLFAYDTSNDVLTSISNNRTFQVGKFEILTNNQLVSRIRDHDQGNCGADISQKELRFENIVGDVRSLHKDPDNYGAVFQVASQFNCLEMVSPNVNPSDGITRYCFDATQGPACALSCPSGTVYRNYFINGIGQGSDQVDLLSEFSSIVENDKFNYYYMRNGYCLPHPSTMGTNISSIKQLSERLNSDPILRKKSWESIGVGVHWNTEVSMEEGSLYESACVGRHRMKIGNCDADSKMSTMPVQKVCQVYTSALPISYSRTKATDWEAFARVVLESAFDSTLAVAALLSKGRAPANEAGDTSSKSERVKVFLTCIGGGAFGNPRSWISDAISKALVTYQHAPLDVYLVHYGRILEMDIQYDNPPLVPQVEKEHDASSKHSIDVHVEKNADFVKYEKMLTMFPQGIVEQCMLRDGVDSKDIDSFMNNN